jgi:hypothetical protein
LIRRAINLHSLWAEKKFLKELFLWNEIWEKNFRYVLRKIEKQIDRLHDWKTQLRRKWCWNWKTDYDFFQKIAIDAYKEKYLPSEVFIRHRAKMIIIKRVMFEIEELSKLDLWFDKSVFVDVSEFYSELYENAKKKFNRILSEFPSTSIKLDIKLAEKSIFTLEENVIEQMFSKWIISDKLYVKFKSEIEEEFYSDVTKNLETFTK